MLSYTHRAAISNQRLLGLEGQTVALNYMDYRRPGHQRLSRLPAEGFIRRFLLHILPEGFVPSATTDSPPIGTDLRIWSAVGNFLEQAPQAELAQPTGTLQPQTCPSCGAGNLRIVGKDPSLAEASGPA